MWRPKGWKNPFHKTSDFGHGKESWCEEPEFTTYEAGADAMLEALKASGHYHNYLQEQTCRSIRVDYESLKRGGWIVFIPDEEK